MSDRVILAIDQGTTNTKALLFSAAGDVVAQASRTMSVQHPNVDWAEQSPDAIWSAVQAVIREVVAAAPGYTTAAIGVSNQRESALLWDPVADEALGPCVLWQCRRTSDHCAQLRQEGREAEIRARTGLGLDPLFSATKLAWLLGSLPDSGERAAAGRVVAGTVDSWLLWKLTGEHKTDLSNASRTQLLDITTGEWDPFLAAQFGIPLGILARPCASDAHFGFTAPGSTALPGGVPVRAVLGDSHAALFGHGIAEEGGVKVTIGTGSSLMTPTERRITSQNGLSSTIAWARSDEITYALEGNITISASAAAFAAQLLGVSDPGALTVMAAQVSDSGGVSFVPALVGLGAPHWQDEARGIISGMSLSTRREHVARAALEAIALQIRDVFVAMEADLGRRLTQISVDGGGAVNDFLLQILADVLDRPVKRMAQPEISARGVARMAGQSVGIELPPAQAQRTFLPQREGGWREALVETWRAAIARASFAS
jgi:glycerol kinase